MRASAGIGEPRAFVLGGNSSTLAFASSFVPEKSTIAARLVPIAQTPIGVVAGDTWQGVGISPESILEWIDRTFAPEDERAFVAPLRDIELLVRIGWSAPIPERLSEESVLNPEDLPDEIVDALAHPPEPIVACAACRRLCVRDHFVWKERQLCAWDYHHTVFGTRGPWRNGVYEERHFETLPRAEYVAPLLLVEESVDAVLSIAGIDDVTAQHLINEVLARDTSGSYLAARTVDGFTLLRERHDPAERSA